MPRPKIPDATVDQVIELVWLPTGNEKRSLSCRFFVDIESSLKYNLITDAAFGRHK